MADNQPLDIEEIVRDSFDEAEAEHLVDKLSQLEPEEIAIALEAMPVEQRVSTWVGLHPEDQVAALTYMRSDARENIFKQLDEHQLRTLVEDMEVDDLIELLDELPQRIYDYACSRLDESQRRWLDTALGYDEDQCGRYADHDMLIIAKNAKVRDAIRLFRQLAEDAEYHDALFVVDRTGRYVGLVHATQILGLGSHLPIETIIDTEAPLVEGEMDLDQGSDIVSRSG
ncbi:MAG TPA: CBS domain-containing protein, partial [Rheinheimera sp.]|nr:CBS domain-containing protein [Rheinheimera sp.]